MIKATFSALSATALASALLITSASASSLVSPAEPVDVAIVLAVDVSDSVSEIDYKIQRQGIANALNDPQVGEVLEKCNAHGVALTFVEWAGFNFKKMLHHEINWRKVTTAAELQDFASQIQRPRKRSTDGFTDIINALRFSSMLLSNLPFEARRKIINISGDGGQNVNPPSGGERIHMSPEQMTAALRLERDAITSLGMVIDALVIPTDMKELERVGPLDEYFRKNVIGGRGSNVTTVNDFTDYAQGLKTNLMSELNNCNF